VSDGSLVLAVAGDDPDAASISFSRDGSLLAVANSSLRVWRLSDGSLVRTFSAGLPAPRFLTRIRFLAGGQSIAVTTDREFLVYDLSKDDPIRIVNLADLSPWAGAMSPDGASLFCGGYRPRIFDPITGSSLAVRGIVEDYVTAAAFSPDRGRIAFGDLSGRIGVFRTPVWMSQPSRNGENTVLRWHGPDGNYQLQRNSTLSTSGWENVGPERMDTTATLSDGSSAGYYRVFLAN
jgi:WD40 repeat protein